MDQSCKQNTTQEPHMSQPSEQRSTHVWLLPLAYFPSSKSIRGAAEVAGRGRVKRTVQITNKFSRMSQCPVRVFKDSSLEKEVVLSSTLE